MAAPSTPVYDSLANAEVYTPTITAPSVHFRLYWTALLMHGHSLIVCSVLSHTAPTCMPR